MKIILLIGKANSGKTTTCRLLKDYLVKNGGAKIICKGLRQVNISKKDNSDFSFLCEYKGKKVLISSQGDQPSKVKHRIDKYTKLIKDGIFVFACRENFTKVINFAMKKAKENFYMVQTQKVENDKEDNERVKNEIIQLIEF